MNAMQRLSALTNVNTGDITRRELRSEGATIMCPAESSALEGQSYFHNPKSVSPKKKSRQMRVLGPHTARQMIHAAIIAAAAATVARVLPEAAGQQRLRH